MLLSHGASMEVRDRHGRSAVMIAAGEGHLGVLEYLVGQVLLWGQNITKNTQTEVLGHSLVRSLAPLTRSLTSLTP